MGNANDSMQTYLTRLRDETGLSWAELSAATQLPDSTIRKIFSGETADPRLETITLIVSAMGGSLDAMVSGKPEARETEMNAINLLRDSYEKRIQDIKSASAHFTESLKKDKQKLFIIACILTIFLMVFIVLDLALGNVGWIRY